MLRKLKSSTEVRKGIVKKKISVQSLRILKFTRVKSIGKMLKIILPLR